MDSEPKVALGGPDDKNPCIFPSYQGIWLQRRVRSRLPPPAERCYGAGGEDGNFVALHQSMECRDAPAERFERLCHGNSIKHAWRPEARDASCHSNGILPLCSGFGSEDPKGGSRDEVALKVEGVVG